MRIVKRLSPTGATEESLQALEREIGFRLPDEYRQFLSEFNGGEPEPSGFVFETNDGPSDSRVRYFLTLDPNERNYAIKEFLRQYRDRIPEGVMPIACDSFGNLVLLDLGAKRVGSIYFWDHEKESMEEPTWDNVSQVARSFNEFEDSLQ
jgi:hypothetical protein